MKRLLLLLLFAGSALADRRREIFPSDYTPSPCAPAEACASFAQSSMRSAAWQFFGLTLDSNWIAAHWDEQMKSFRPFCTKLATCQATPGNHWWFCNDVFIREIRATCDQRYPRTTNLKEWEQCDGFARIFALGVDQQGKTLWEKAQDCAKALPQSRRKMEVWLEPATIPIDYDGEITIFAINTDTHVPVEASVRIEGQILYSRESPTGKLLTLYPFKWPRKLRRVTNAQGHTDLVPPDVVLEAPDYETIRVQLPTIVPKLKVTMAPLKLRRGKNRVTVTAFDDATGTAVEMRVMVGDQQVGNTNEKIEIELPKGKRPEIWLASLFNAYSDVVVVPAQK